MKRPCALAAFFLLTGLLSGCASEPDPTSSTDAETADEAEVVAAKKKCSSQAYNSAFASYKQAVDHAKLRNAGAICEEGTTLLEIATDLHTAVTTCGEFRAVVATSKWAQPVRTALKGNLALAGFDGRLTLTDATGKVTLAGLDKALVGTTVFGPAPGVYGNMSRLTFAASGAATLSTLEVDSEGNATWTDTAAKWSLSGTTLTVTVGGKATVYKVGVADGYDLTFTPASGDTFSTMPSECEA